MTQNQPKNRSTLKPYLKFKKSLVIGPRSMWRSADQKYVSGVGQSGTSSSTPNEAAGILTYSGDSGAGTSGEPVTGEKNAAPRRVLGKRKGEQMVSPSVDRSEKGVSMCWWNTLSPKESPHVKKRREQRSEQPVFMKTG